MPDAGKVTLAGSAPGTCLRHAQHGEPLVLIQGVQDIVLRDLVLDGNGSAAPVIEIRGPGVAGLTIENVVIRNFNGDGILIVGADGDALKTITFRNVTIDCGQTRGGSAVVVAPSISAIPNSQLRFLGCELKGTFATGLDIADAVENLLVEGCKFSDGHQAIRFRTIPIQSNTQGTVPVEKWQVAGPWPADQVPAFDYAKAPDLAGSFAVGDRKFGWKAIETDLARGGFVDLAAGLAPAASGAAVGYATIQMDPDDVRPIFMGSDDQVRVWVNGDPIYRFDSLRGWKIYHDAVAVPLKKGTNHVWVRSETANPNWGFSMHYGSTVTAVTKPEWQNVTIRNNSLSKLDMGIVVAASPLESSCLRFDGNRFTEVRYPPLLVKDAAKVETLSPITIVANNSDEAPANRIGDRDGLFKAVDLDQTLR